MQNTCYKFNQNFYYSLKHLLNGELPIIFCVGNNLIGNSLAPIIANNLKELNIPAFVYGDFSTPITYKTAVKDYNFIKSLFKNPRILVIDSCLGNKNLLGKIYVNRGELPFSSPLLPLGDYYITAVVADNKKPHKNLKNADLGLVLNLADTITSGIKRYVEGYFEPTCFKPAKIKKYSK